MLWHYAYATAWGIECGDTAFSWLCHQIAISGLMLLVANKEVKTIFMALVGIKEER